MTAIAHQSAAPPRAEPGFLGQLENLLDNVRPVLQQWRGGARRARLGSVFNGVRVPVNNRASKSPRRRTSRSSGCIRASVEPGGGAAELGRLFALFLTVDGPTGRDLFTAAGGGDPASR
jgi:hypothetical protein